MAIQKTYAWIHPEYKKSLKIKACEDNMSLLELTEKLAKNRKIYLENDEQNDQNYKKKKFVFSI